MKTNIRWMSMPGAMIVAMVVFGAGCNASDEPPQPIQQLVRVPLESGNAIEFYEAQPGVILVSETGMIGSKPTFTDEQLRGKDPLQLLLAVKPAEMAVPAAFTEALTRRAQLRSGALGRAPEDWRSRPRWQDQAARESIGTQQSAVTKSTSTGAGQTGSSSWVWFYNTFCGNDGDGNWCLLNQFGGASQAYYDAEDVFATVAASYGNVTAKSEYRTWWSWSTYGQWTVPVGRYRSWHLFDFFLDFDVRSSVSGSGYHHAGLVWY